ncbi:MAG: Fic family protein [Anaerolineae bacterium]|jgi:Fic family protein|nr:Fic family protein [Anaerolineae bacterium]MBT6046213.1 Fic family protein [Candidatus Scalindua sp.]MBT6322760.1 Fic family protein [Anaerolineae bacterium]MBT6811050.1 Fic family protein [Anaerolineae bacterium]MBT7483829.1 Fic family protein [Candidatus Peregrinibacteria bacterium]
MDIKDFKAGTYRAGHKYRYFLPEKINHSFFWTDKGINELLEQASLKLGELNAFSQFVPDIDMFIKMHITKEAVISSRIEGTQTNMEEALIDKPGIDPERRDDWQEVNNYVRAMNTAIEELNTLPLSNRLIKNTHKTLLSSGRGEYKTPGEFRRSQNWIGGASLADATFIPPTHTELPELLSDLELFLHNTEIQIPHLIKIALAHYQFETIHPFLDGNGRIGRLLITLYLVSQGILDAPLLYLSDFFEKNKTLYYDNLTFVRTKNDLGQWIKFFLVGVIQTAEKGVDTLDKIVSLKKSIEEESILLMGRRTKQGMVLFHQLFSQPVLTSKEVESMTGLSRKAANDLIKVFIEKNILKETTGYQRNRVFIFDEYMKLFR